MFGAPIERSETARLSSSKPVVIADWHRGSMPIHETRDDLGSRRARRLRDRISSDLADARRGSGLSLRRVSATSGITRRRLMEIERGDPSAMTIDLISTFAATLGLELAASLYPVAEPVRDQGHLRLLARFRARLGPGLRMRTEVPIPLPGDRRSADGVVAGTDFDAVVEAETHLHDIQKVERNAAAKQRDLGTTRVILLVADTRHNRDVVRRVAELRERFPVPTRACLAALARGTDPGGDCLVIL